MAVGASHNDSNGSSSGHVRIYNFVEDDWSQKGGDIDGKSAGDESGKKVLLSADGTIIAIENRDSSGHVKIYNNAKGEKIGKTIISSVNI